MPAFVTHMLLGPALQTRLTAAPSKWLARHRNAFSWGLIGPDVLFFHPGGGLPALGSALHRGNPSRFFEALSRACLATGESSELTGAYLAGMVGHYRLDATAHPYVYSQQRRDEGKSRDRQNGGAHHRIEADIDTALYRLTTNESIARLDVKARWPLPRAEAGAIGRCLSAALRRTLNAEASPNALADAFFATRRIETLLLLAGRQEPLRLAVGLADRLRRGSPASAHVVRARVDYDVLNLRRQPWDDAAQGLSCRRESFPALFEQAAALAARDIERLWECHAARRPFTPGYTLPFGNGAPQ